MTKIISITVLVLMIVLFPPAALAFVSQNAIPGDNTYPVKRKLEDIILAIASVNPHTKAMFEVNLSDTRFSESRVLLTEGKDASPTLNELVTTANVAASQINQLSDPSQKQQLAAQLSESINKYEQELEQVKTQMAYQTPQGSSTQAPIIQTSSAPPASSNTPVYSSPISTPAGSNQSPAPSSSSVAVTGTSATISNPSPTPQAIPQSQSNNQPQSPSSSTQNIDQTINQLQQVQDKLNGPGQSQNNSQGNSDNHGNGNSGSGNGQDHSNSGNGKSPNGD